MRLIVPSEVISSFKPSDFNYQQNKNFKVNHHHNSNSHHQINNKQNLYENKDPFDNRGSSSWPQFNHHDGYQAKVKIEDFQNENDGDEERNRRFQNNQHRVDKGMQQKVYAWAMKEFADDKKVQMITICRYAKHVSKNKQFQGSTGWCSNFLNRYPQLKKLVKNKALKNMISLNSSDAFRKKKQSNGGGIEIQGQKISYESWNNVKTKRQQKDWGYRNGQGYKYSHYSDQNEYLPQVSNEEEFFNQANQKFEHKNIQFEQNSKEDSSANFQIGKDYYESGNFEFEGQDQNTL